MFGHYVYLHQVRFSWGPGANCDPRRSSMAKVSFAFHTGTELKITTVQNFFRKQLNKIGIFHKRKNAKFSTWFSLFTVLLLLFLKFNFKYGKKKKSKWYYSIVDLNGAMSLLLKRHQKKKRKMARLDYLHSRFQQQDFSKCYK